MEITCPRCRSRHLVDPPSSARARTRPLRFRCSECGNTFPLQGDSVALPPAMLPIEPPSRAGPEPRIVSPGEPVEMLRVGGDVYSVPDLATLQRWILEGRASRDDMVSQHGMRWTALRDRPDFSMFFAAADAVTGRGAGAGGASTGLPMADDEEIYVQESDPPSEDAPTTFGTPPEDELPTLQEVPGAEEHEALPALEAGAAGDHEERPTRVEEADPEPVDELPPEMFLPPRRFVDNPDDLRAAPSTPAFRGEALSLGFQLGRDADTQEATMEETRHSDAGRASSADLTDHFMRTGVLPTAPPARTPTLSPEPVGGPPAPPPIVLEGARTPRTVAPLAPAPLPPYAPPAPAPVAERSILDDDYDAPPPARKQGFGLEVFIGGALLLALLLAGAGALMHKPAPPEAPAAPAASAPVEAAEAAPVEAAAAAPAEAVPAEPATEAPPAEAEAAAKAEAAKEAEAAAKAEAAKEAEAAAKAEAAKEAEAAAKAEAAAQAKAAREAAKAAPKAVPVAKAPPAEPAPPGGNPTKLVDQGWKAMDKGDVESAHGFFARALQKSPTNAEALAGRGYANEKLGDKVSARADYCAALEHAGNNTDLTRELTGNLRRLGVGCGP